MKIIKYKFIAAEVNRGTVENPQIEQIIKVKTIRPWSAEAEEIAKAEAYNGEYTIEDDGTPEPEPTEQEQLRADVDFLLAMGGVL